MIALRYDNDLQRTDLVRPIGPLETDAGLDTAVTISLFSDAQRRATDPAAPLRGGWWGDALEADAIGSRLWVFARSGLSPDVLRGIESAAKDALKWLVKDGVATSVTAVATRVGQNLRLQVAIVRAASGGTYDYLWEGQLNAV
jgi:phage gp46-like protein